jgi:hypothetical protein
MITEILVIGLQQKYPVLEEVLRQALIHSFRRVAIPTPFLVPPHGDPV